MLYQIIIQLNRADTPLLCVSHYATCKLFVACLLNNVGLIACGFYQIIFNSLQPVLSVVLQVLNAPPTSIQGSYLFWSSLDILSVSFCYMGHISFLWHYIYEYKTSTGIGLIKTASPSSKSNSVMK